MLSEEELYATIRSDKFAEAWESGEIQESALALLGYRYVPADEEDKEEPTEK